MDLGCLISDLLHYSQLSAAVVVVKLAPGSLKYVAMVLLSTPRVPAQWVMGDLMPVLKEISPTSNFRERRFAHGGREEKEPLIVNLRIQTKSSKQSFFHTGLPWQHSPSSTVRRSSWRGNRTTRNLGPKPSGEFLGRQNITERSAKFS